MKKNILFLYLLFLAPIVVHSQSFSSEDIKFEMVFVEGGEFSMGCQGEACLLFGGTAVPCPESELPVHEVALSDYNIGKYEVTQAQWQHVMGNNPSQNEGCKDCPVENVTWKEAQAFCEKLSEMTGKKVRLPTEAEWEYAARGGNKSKQFCYAGTNLPTLSTFALYNNDGKGATQPHRVGSKNANELGLYDVTGNVAEWCSDWYDKNYYKDSAAKNPKGPETGTYRVVRGGDFLTHYNFLYLTARHFKAKPTKRSKSRGFRIVVEAE